MFYDIEGILGCVIFLFIDLCIIILNMVFILFLGCL